MSRRLKGYAIRCYTGEWFDGTGLDGYSECPWTADKAKRHLFDEAADAYTYASTYTESSKLRIVPVFAVPKGNKPKPAPVVAGEGRYAVVYQTATMPHAKMEPHVFLSRAQVDEWLAWNKHRADGVVRILADGEHEAAVEAGEPVAWDVVGDDGLALACDDEEHADEVLRKHGGRKRALYDEAAVEAFARTIRTRIGNLARAGNEDMQLALDRALDIVDDEAAKGQAK